MLAPHRKREKHVANIKSAEKQNRKMIKNRARNRAAMATLRTAVKKARAAVDGKAEDASNLVKEAVSIVDSAVTKGILKRRTASRYVSRLATRSA
jgi:small subunit ribosomal protein S20